jgi:hypothetical protein
VAALIVMLCLLAFNRAGSQGVIGALARIALVMVGAGVSWVALASRSDVAAERRVLDARVHELWTRAGSMPGAAFACLDAMAGDTVEAACERALFQSSSHCSPTSPCMSAGQTPAMSLPPSAISAASSSATALVWWRMCSLSATAARPTPVSPLCCSTTRTGSATRAPTATWLRDLSGA